MLSFGLIKMEINRRVFYGVETPIESTKDKWRTTSHFWEADNFCSSFFDVMDFVDRFFWIVLCWTLI